MTPFTKEDTSLDTSFAAADTNDSQSSVITASPGNKSNKMKVKKVKRSSYTKDSNSNDNIGKSKRKSSRNKRAVKDPRVGIPKLSDVDLGNVNAIRAYWLTACGVNETQAPDDTYTLYKEVFRKQRVPDLKLIYARYLAPDEVNKPIPSKKADLIEALLTRTSKVITMMNPKVKSTAKMPKDS